MQPLAVLRLALSVLSDKLVTVLFLILSAVLTGWVMYEPDWIRVAGLAIFVLFAYLVVPRKGVKNEAPEATD